MHKFPILREGSGIDAFIIIIFTLISVLKDEASGVELEGVAVVCR